MIDDAHRPSSATPGSGGASAHAASAAWRRQRTQACGKCTALLIQRAVMSTSEQPATFRVETGNVHASPSREGGD